MNRYDNWKLRSPYRDYEPDPHCDICGGTGYVKEDADPDNEHECRCAGEEENRRRWREEQDQIAEDRYYRGMR